jgi:voltage-gated potassium channel
MTHLPPWLRRVVASLGPHGYLAALVALDAALIVQPALARMGPVWHGDWLADAWRFVDTSALIVLPRLVVGGGLATMTLGLVLRARVAWVLTLLLLAGAAAIEASAGYRGHLVLAFTVVLAALLVYEWRHFDRASIAASGLFAFLAIVSLLIYSVFGTLYFGDGFAPPVRDLATAAYFSIVSMSTVGYGDIVPHSSAARLFTVSMIVFGITVFATSISAIIGPVVGGNLKRIVKGGISNVIRKNHYLIIGVTPVALSVYTGLHKRGYPITVIVPPNVEHSYPREADLVVGDATDHATLDHAGAATARAVLIMRSDDAENAFIVLAIKELAPNVRTIALVNQQRNLQRLKLLKPDMVFSPQQLAGELLASSLSNETIDNDVITQLLFGATQTR